MIKLEYRPWKPDSEFHNFLRAAGYVIPYDFGGEDA